MTTPPEPPEAGNGSAPPPGPDSYEEPAPTTPGPVLSEADLGPADGPAYGPDAPDGAGSGAAAHVPAPDAQPPRPASRAAKRAPAPYTRPEPAGRLVFALVCVAVLAAGAGLGFHRVYALRDIGPVAAIAAVPVLLSALISWPRRRTWALWIAIILTVGGWTLVAGLTLFHGDFGVIGGALRNSWKATLTTLMPAPGRPELLVLPHILVWFAAATGAELVLRSRTRAFPALPAIAVFGVALLIGVGGPGSNLPVAAGLVALTAVLVIVRGGGRASRAPAGIAMAAVLAVLAALAGPVLPVAGTPYDPRATVKAPPPQQRDSISPLDRVSAWLQTPDQQMFTVHTTSPENWRLAVLDRFDGITWTSGASFVPAGSRVPAAEHTRHIAATAVDQHFTIQNLPGVWVPAADRPRTVKGLAVTVDPVSGVLTSAQQLHTGQAYDVTSAARDYDADELATAEPARDAEAQAATTLPESPGTTARNAQVPAFRKLAEQVTGGQSTGFARAAKLADYLRTTAKYDVSGLPGHTYAQLNYFLTRSRRGTSEQFATAYAVLARSVGLPTRVVVGFRPGIGGNGAFEVRSGDVLVWPEVDFAGLGWVPFYPTPEQQGRSQQSGSVPAGDTQQKLEQAQKNAASKNKGTGSGTGKQPPPALPAKPPVRHATPWWVFALAAAALVPVAYLAAALVLPVLRRRRRRKGATPADRIAGAWEQTVETLHAVGLPPATALTAHEVAGFGGRTVTGTEHHLRPLADLVNRAEYAGRPPDPAAAETAWQHTDQIGRLVASAAGPMRRVGRRLHPRTLRSTSSGRSRP
ncbi:transglutaminaseTgpA domain-containing protein [Actinomadura sp. DC4]|uniref:transglutaminaseTgpA domain-containing protein n=1 Tax=Actinomadura sp. DC4 TaxID=3055069 RepID=UPI0025B0AFAF|nr:transglutaminaseTgpA domain-containing protein [Actinomadura sp. DC4]MDN3357635.1 transglutaminaseTgpA domain-containing protein [Actinomadura sp. DC4]